LFLPADKLGSLLAGAYEEPERSIIVAEALHAIIGHRRKGAPFTVEAGIVRVADALDLARGRSPVGVATGRCGWRSRCPTAPASTRSTSCWPPSCAAQGSKSTSR